MSFDTANLDVPRPWSKHKFRFYSWPSILSDWDPKLELAGYLIPRRHGHGPVGCSTVETVAQAPGVVGAAGRDRFQIDLITVKKSTVVVVVEPQRIVDFVFGDLHGQGCVRPGRR